MSGGSGHALFATPYTSATERSHFSGAGRTRSDASVPFTPDSVPSAHNLSAIAEACSNEIESIPEPCEEGDGVYIGMKVRHGKFGVGVVRKIEGEDDGQKVIVWFNSVGPKKLMLRFAGLERA
jgi:DNA helicase-2/ATP-dependent DNA helicase PcrA